MKVDMNFIKRFLRELLTDEERLKFLTREYIRISNIEMDGFFIPLIEKNAIPKKNIVSKTDDGKILAVYETKKIPKDDWIEFYTNKFKLMELRERYRVKVEKKKRKREKEIVFKLIDEYSGSHYRFLFNYLDGGYESYVFENTNKIAYRKTYGVEHLRREFKGICSKEVIQQKVIETCEKTIDYIKRNYVYVH